MTTLQMAAKLQDCVGAAKLLVDDWPRERVIIRCLLAISATHSQRTILGEAIHQAVGLPAINQIKLLAAAVDEEETK